MSTANSFGHLLKITTFGESHGPAIGVVVDGFPSQFEVNWNEFHREMARRKPGQSAFTTARNESDEVELLSGIYQGKTTGAPIALLIRNQDQRPADYDEISRAYRPGHADFTYEAKFGIRDPRGGGRSSARETVARVAAGALAQQFLEKQGIFISSYVSSVHEISAPIGNTWFDRSSIEQSSVRCPHPETSKRIEELILETKEKGDSVGGVITTVVKGIPAGLGNPVFHRFEAQLAYAMLSINATKGFEMGDGFESTHRFGSENNDVFEGMVNGRAITTTNHSGGVLGGITNGMPLWFHVAFKPTSTISMEQQTINSQGKSIKLQSKGRHDPCVLPRAVPIVDAMTALTVLDFWLWQRAYQTV
jgi:chorismate synthase